MATINRQLAEELVERNGRYKGDRMAYCVVRYQNRTKYGLSGVSLYDPDARINCFDYAVFYRKGTYERFMVSDTVGGVDVLWGSKKFNGDEEKRRRGEESRELHVDWEEILAGVIAEEERTRRSRRGKER
ncbi:hypothetical protein A2634_01915 [Candidatus Amesbacteria bacterium RIFCSPHIGHO2_01_FULL_48_32]|uniref:Uncharacterized protein n=1 Tax=Candidatus Amesbacteria bacterium RIFCSPLOWO2_01_FULL_48_25 TaxID=1797259 RepID=A0A1F4ZEP0_9BACT|nr:MAG: hypothetical protein A2634_01915 [Candidatus Amesbacteria bacterium RIFCSPHIGHO2_01_FULL_48_32]OGD04346.1 MAG: hypothetical protein A2989_04915 [Candidatus Amesbacteria bacterium RIFCSPLOWO2_01_FULL_48_25]HJZ06181.1 hypothetical protein [Patescibacteria group bacterium]